MAAADTQAIIDEIQAIIRGREDNVIPAVRQSIHSHISSQSIATCLTIVTRDSSGSTVRRYTPSPPDLTYVEVLTAFIRKQPYCGYTLDSGLSDTTASVVADTFSRELDAVGDDIAARLIPFLLRNDVFMSSLSGALTEAYKGEIPNYLRAQISDQLAITLKSAMSSHIDTASVAAIKAGAVKVIAASVSTPIATKLAIMIVHTLTATLKPLIIKVLASTAFKAAIAAKIKAIVMASLAGAFIQFLAAKLGITAGAAFLWMLLPVLVAWLGYEAWNFPEKLARRVADDVAQDLKTGFVRTSTSIAETIVEMILVQGASLMAKELVKDGDVQEIVRSAIDNEAT